MPSPGPLDAPDMDEPDEEGRRPLSPVRVALALLVAVGAIYGGIVGVRSKLTAAATTTTATWFAPYVDATVTPTYSFQNPAANPAAQSVLGFVVSDPSAPCTPSWGGAYTLAQADQSLALGARVAELAQQGAQAIVSFGGRANTELAVACTRPGALAAAYQAVIDRYHLRTIDLDVEGAALNDAAATRRRAAAIRRVQLAARRHHQHLAVWLTLPVEPSGLQDNALGVLDAMLAARVDLAGVNVMAMDFSDPGDPGSMLGQVESAASAAQVQLGRHFRRYGVDLGAAQLWQRLGVTVMIGQNDVAGERFSTGDATGLVAFAEANHLGRVSMWSLNRDSQCGSTFARVGVSANTCSGAAQSPLQFSHIFAALTGSASATGTVSALPPQPDTNPADAPFPLWSPGSSYQSGYKVVRDGNIYQAKWYNSGEDPAAQVQDPWQTPWELLGPVLPGDHAPPLPTLAPGTYPQWSSNGYYRSGDRVLFKGLGYRAKWDNQGASPAGALSDPAASPWQPLYTIPGEPAPASG